MNNKTKTRIYLKEDLFIDKILKISSNLPKTQNIYHHLCNVLRLKESELICVFNQPNDNPKHLTVDLKNKKQYGEFLAKILKINKKEIEIKILEFLRPYKKDDLEISLFFAPLKKEMSDFVFFKATEIGVHHIRQIISEFTVNKPQNLLKIKDKLILASCQCERLDIPNIHETISLEEFNHNLKEDSLNLWMNESLNGENIITTLTKNKGKYQKINLLVGPEGGFSKKEKDLLSHNSKINNVYFKGNILRAETACIAGLTLIKALS